MKFPVVPDVLKKLSSKEMIVMIAFILYIILPVATPSVLIPLINSYLGLVIIFAITVSLFVYSTSVLGILFLFVAYELLRRSSIVQPAYLDERTLTQYIPNSEPVSVTTQSEKDADMKAMNPPADRSLEEEVVGSSVSVMGHGFTFTETSFVPVADNVRGASLL